MDPHALTSSFKSLTVAGFCCSEIIGTRVWRSRWYFAVHVQHLRRGNVHVGFCRGPAGESLSLLFRIPSVSYFIPTRPHLLPCQRAVVQGSESIISHATSLTLASRKLSVQVLGPVAKQPDMVLSQFPTKGSVAHQRTRRFPAASCKHSAWARRSAHTQTLG